MVPRRKVTYSVQLLLSIDKFEPGGLSDAAVKASFTVAYYVRDQRRSWLKPFSVIGLKPDSFP